MGLPTHGGRRGEYLSFEVAQGLRPRHPLFFLLLLLFRASHLVSPVGRLEDYIGHYVGKDFKGASTSNECDIADGDAISTCKGKSNNLQYICWDPAGVGERALALRSASTCLSDLRFGTWRDRGYRHVSYTDSRLAARCLGSWRYRYRRTRYMCMYYRV